MSVSAKPSTASELHDQAEAVADAAPVVHAPRLLSVQEAIAAVMRDLPSIGKDDRYPGAENYQYRGIETVAKHVQPLLARHGLAIVPKARITKVEQSPAMKDGWQDVYIEVAWVIVGPDGSSLIAQTTGIGRDRSDKGANKAQTQAFKYLLLHLFCVADGKDDADGHVYEHDRQEAPAWNAGMVKAELVNLLGGKDEAKQAWEYASGDALTEFGPEVAKRIADAWQGRTFEAGEAPAGDTGEGQAAVVAPDVPSSVTSPASPSEGDA